MLEIQNQKVNSSGSAFLLVSSIAVNLLVWALLKDLISILFKDIYMIALFKSLIAIIYALIYFLFTGGVIKF